MDELRSERGWGLWLGWMVSRWSGSVSGLCIGSSFRIGWSAIMYTLEVICEMFFALEVR